MFRTAKRKSFLHKCPFAHSGEGCYLQEAGMASTSSQERVSGTPQDLNTLSILQRDDWIWQIICACTAWFPVTSPAESSCETRLLNFLP
ncbi:hypothetical protein AV530_003920 [Patagioenas fasciata monilis]|uniref:Uncharacterized protein n=1 Tax=Patagioenas fasciata monilis TaxID=372326 RepID=A0A1V4KYZ3_PATFA|nr:hypothetical protein AV530_003920 [Patagioenas fasciata monilis]